MMEAVIKVIEALAGQPWALVAVLGIGGIGYLISLLIKNTAVTTALASRISEGDVSKVILEIRADQVLNNEGRRKTLLKVEMIEQRLTAIEQDVEELRCTKYGCPNRAAAIAFLSASDKGVAETLMAKAVAEDAGKEVA